MKQRLIIIVGLLVVVLAVGGAAAWWVFLGPGKPVVGGIAATPTAITAAAPTKTSAAVKPTPEPEPTEMVEIDEPETSVGGMQGCITIRVLNTRIGPDKQFPAAGGLGKGECVPFDARTADGEWLRLADRFAERGDRLWASRYYIELQGDRMDLPVVE